MIFGDYCYHEHQAYLLQIDQARRCRTQHFRDLSWTAHDHVLVPSEVSKSDKYWLSRLHSFNDGSPEAWLIDRIDGSPETEKTNDVHGEATEGEEKVDRSASVRIANDGSA